MSYECGRPARAGMNPGTPSRRDPQERGNPVQAGMNRRFAEVRGPRERRPRAHGDEPYTA